jgi:hypothetical protein
LYTAEVAISHPRVSRLDAGDVACMSELWPKAPDRGPRTISPRIRSSTSGSGRWWATVATNAARIGGEPQCAGHAGDLSLGPAPPPGAGAATVPIVASRTESEEPRGAKVEFAASWSQNATNIVAQKYFRGQLGWAAACCNPPVSRTRWSRSSSGTPRRATSSAPGWDYPRCDRRRGFTSIRGQNANNSVPGGRRVHGARRARRDP